jgi:ABC-type multidrug transport system permease subunit
VLVIPAHFTSNYLTGGKVEWELIKNPAEQIHPAVLEELLGVATTGLNAVSRNFNSEFPAWRRVAEDKADYHEIARLIDTSGNRIQAFKKYLFPPLIGWTNRDPESASLPVAAPDASKNSPASPAAPTFNLFGYMLPGMAGLFLLLLANQAMRDLHEELSLRTFERYNTIREGLMPFVGGKALFGFVIVTVGSAILLVGGGLMFRIDWPRPAQLAGLTLAYAGFATGLMSVMVAVSPDQRQANAFNSVISMVLGMAGGCMFPPGQLPATMRRLVTERLPTYWYSQTARDLWWTNAPWLSAAAKLLAVGVVCLAASAWLFRRRFREGIKT